MSIDLTAEIHVWRIRLDRATPLAPTAGETARAHRFATPTLRRRYLRSHAALRDILQRHTSVLLEFAVHERGKPYLAADPTLHFNLAHSHDLALVAVTRACPIGVDVERLRPLPEYQAIAQPLFPQ